jgi:diacylglycerol kinase family enzyme
LLTVILNPASGSVGGPDLQNRIVELFRAEQADARVVLLDPERADSIIADAVRSKPDALVAGGGDGTANSVATAIVGGTIPFGILPLGTLNHFAKDLHIPLDLAHAVKTITAGHLLNVDVGRVNGRVFLNNSSIGVYPSVVQHREQLRKQGYWKWFAFALAIVKILQRSREVLVRLEVNGSHIVTRTPFVFIGNDEYQIEGLRMGARARLDAGLLFAYLAPRVKTRQLPRLALRALAGRASDHGTFKTFSAAEMWVDTPKKHRVKVATDGEVTVMTGPLHYQSLPRALKVFAPAVVAGAPTFASD